MSAYLDTEQIAKLLGLTREYVTDKLTKRPDFPAPTINRTRRLRRWSESDVMDWARAGQGSRAAMSSADSR